ncbi:hypothetical protein ACQKEF_13690 [Pseudomonas oryzihabitans]|uniref:hypothetical protein n=1 Tax=Pseudomonas oryzihabitans TaxID=47885 RepID=UPI003D06D742
MAVIGGGNTRLGYTLDLAREQGVQTVVLEADQMTWKFSGRNGSVARTSGGRVPVAKSIQWHGPVTANGCFADLPAGLKTLRRPIREDHITSAAQRNDFYNVASATG